MKYFEAHDITEYKDADGKTPEILMIDGNRAAGKTTALSRKFVEDFLFKREKFMLVYRYQNELVNISEAFFKDIRGLFFEGHNMTDKTRAHGAYIELFLDGESCGYAVSLNTAAKLKHYSHVFSDVSKMLFDEYQLENGFYVPNEIQKFISLHMTVARGQGEVVRFVPVYMLSNSVSLFNPYYDAFGIAERINSRTKMLRGSGWVLLRLMLKEVAAEQEKSAFNRAFSGASRYVQAATDNSFLNDDTYNIEKRETVGMQTQFIFRSENKTFAVYSNGISFHVKRSGVIDGAEKYGAKHADRNGEWGVIRFSLIFRRLEYFYMNGNITFQDTNSKRAFMALLFDRS